LIPGLALTFAGCGPQASTEPPAAGSAANGSTAASAPIAAPSSVDDPCPLEERAAALGVTFRHQPGGPTLMVPEIVGGGVGVLDANGDGRLDLILRGAATGAPHPDANGQPVDRLFLQDDVGRFTAAELPAELEPRYPMGVTVGDINNDGRPDLFLSGVGGGRLLLNAGGGRFEAAPPEAIPGNTGLQTSAAFIDIDRDGRLDLFVARYTPGVGRTGCRNRVGVPGYCHPRFIDGAVDLLLLNETPAGAAAGAVRFRDVSTRLEGARAARGLGVVLCDVNRDGFPDLYVANDAEPNHLWVNRGDGSFREEAARRGAAVDGAAKPQGSMGLALGDGDGDGFEDIFVTNFAGEYTTCYQADARGFFRDASAALGLLGPTRTVTGFGVALVDLDGDGLQELVQINGKVSLEPGQAPNTPNGLEAADAYFPRFRERPIVFRAGGARYTPLEVGALPNTTLVGRGLAVGDLDRDGRPDLISIGIHEPAGLWMNRAQDSAPRRTIRAVDPKHGGRDAEGARLTLQYKGGGVRQRRILSSGSYLTAHEPALHEAPGGSGDLESIQVEWPDGSRTAELFRGPFPERTIVLQRGSGVTMAETKAGGRS
jgi:hypothetical protein